MSNITDDPVADFHRHDAEQEAQLKRLPVCDNCDEIIQEDCYIVDCEILCRDCIDDLYKVSLDDYLNNL